VTWVGFKQFEFLIGKSLHLAKHRELLLQKWHDFLATKQIEIRATSVRVSGDALIVDLSDGRTVSALPAWYPRLLHGTAPERDDHQFIGDGLGIHWPQLDEDISVKGILAGRRSRESTTSFEEWLASRSGAT
jgi:uncharacterized protein DUF2442